MEEYQPLDLTQEEALRRAIERLARQLGGPRGSASSLRIHPRCLRVHEPRRPAAATTSIASTRAPALGLRRLGVVASRASHLGELGAVGLRRAPDTSTDASPFTATGSGIGSTKGADGALAVSLGPAAAHRPHRGR
jgi:hypothetical protein